MQRALGFGLGRSLVGCLVTRLSSTKEGDGVGLGRDGDDLPAGDF